MTDCRDQKLLMGFEPKLPLTVNVELHGKDTHSYLKVIANSEKK